MFTIADFGVELLAYKLWDILGMRHKLNKKKLICFGYTLHLYTEYFIQYF